LITTIEQQAQSARRKQHWPLCMEEIEHGGPPRTAGIEDFLLGRFDEECLSDDPPESDWSDWFPPPPRLSWDELGMLAEWVDEQADRHNLWPDPEQYPLSFFEGEEYEWLFLMLTSKNWRWPMGGH